MQINSYSAPSFLGIDSRANKINIATGVISSFPLVLRGFISCWRIEYDFKTKHISILNKSLPQNVTKQLIKREISKFNEIATQPHTDILQIKCQVEMENFKWGEYLVWLKQNHPDNFSALFKLSLESKEEVQSVLKTLNLMELEEQCEKLDADDQIAIKSSDREIHLSKKLLSLFIPYYQKAFSGNFNEKDASEIGLPFDIDFIVFQNTLIFLFFGEKLKIQGEDLHQFFQLADCLNMPFLIEGIEQWLIGNGENIEILDLIALNEGYELSQNFKIYVQEKVNKEAVVIIKEGMREAFLPKSLEKIAPYVSELDLQNSKLDNLEFLKIFPNLKSVKLPSSIDDKRLTTLPILNTLNHLGLSKCKITDAGLEHIANFTQLSSLKLSSLDITNAGLKYIANLTQLQSLSFCRTSVDDEGLEYIANLTQLQSLDLSFLEITGEGLEHIANLTKLRSLNLKSTGIEDAVLAHIANLTQLQSLDLGDTHITDAGLAHIANLSRLQSLKLGDKITDTGLIHIANLTQLRSLKLGNEITDAGLVYIPNFTQLLTLSLGYKITDTGLIHIANLTQLQSLKLGNKIADEGFVHIANLANLKFLKLGYKTTDTGLVHIANLTQLQSLDLGDTSITDAGLVHIANLIQLQSLKLGYKITDEGLVHIANLTQLQSLDLRNTSIKDAGLVHIANLTQLQSLKLGCKTTVEGLVHIANLKQLKLLDLNSKVKKEAVALYANLRQLL